MFIPGLWQRLGLIRLALARWRTLTVRRGRASALAGLTCSRWLRDQVRRADLVNRAVWVSDRCRSVVGNRYHRPGWEVVLVGLFNVGLDLILFSVRQVVRVRNRNLVTWDHRRHLVGRRLAWLRYQVLTINDLVGKGSWPSRRQQP